MRLYFKSAFFLMGSLMLCSCATQTPLAPSSSFVNASHWRADGVLAYKDSRQNFNAGYVWINQGQHYQINILGPLGAWRAVLEGGPGLTTLSTSDGKVHQAAKPVILMQQSLGWSIPVDDLLDWMWAMPAKTQKAKVTRDQSGNIKEIQQAGWVIRYSQYQLFNGMQVPNRIELTQDGKKITVIVQHRESEK